MILQALNAYYEILLRDPESEIPAFGYGRIGVSFALNISRQGELLDVLPQYDTVQRGKRMVEVPRPMFLPQRVERAGLKIAANFLWDNAAYVLGLSERDETQPDYSLQRFDAFRKLHRTLLREVPSEAAMAILAFLDEYDPGMGREHAAIAKHLDEILGGGNLVFLTDSGFPHRDAEIRQAWEAHVVAHHGKRMQCLVTGEVAPIARLHASIKGVRGANPRGAKLVSFNKPAYESYNRADAQGQNSPVSRKATSAYTTALNYLLSDANPNRKFYLGDATVVYWAESENRAYESAFATILDPEYGEDEAPSEQAGRREAEATLKALADKIRQARPLDLSGLFANLGDENPRFYVLGLAPNAARLSVRFFITDPFEKIVENIMGHYRDLSIVKEFDDQADYLSVGRILYETVSRKSQDRQAAPLLAGAVFRSILTNSAYPAALFYAIIKRIRADMDDPAMGVRKVNYPRAAVIKAFLTRKYRHQPKDPLKEVLTMALNEQSTMPAYVLGRLFAVLEKAQHEAIGSINASIKDRYFTSACATPGSVFPLLLRLAQHHIAKAEYGYANDHRIQQLLDLLDLEKNPFPAHLNLDEQGVFVLGYYHQRAAFYARSNEKRAETTDTASEK